MFLIKNGMVWYCLRANISSGVDDMFDALSSSLASSEDLGCSSHFHQRSSRLAVCAGDSMRLAKLNLDSSAATCREVSSLRAMRWGREAGREFGGLYLFSNLTGIRVVI
jgi:hypothetical protein